MFDAMSLEVFLVSASALLIAAAAGWRIWRHLSLRGLVGHHPFQVSRWFARVVGMDEPAFRKLDEKHFRKIIVYHNSDDKCPDLLQSLLSKCLPHSGHLPPSLAIHNALTGTATRAGQFFELGIREMMTVHATIFGDTLVRGAKPMPLLLLARHPGSQNRKAVDVGHLQSLPEFNEAVFQVASNFNGIEAISQDYDPDESLFCSNYINDHTQGPAASVSAGGAAITRVFTGLHSLSEPPYKWRQTKTRQVNFLSRALPQLSGVKVVNGYVVLDSLTIASFEENSADDILLSCKVGYHRDCQVTSGHRCLRTGIAEAAREGQTIDQVFAAAVNLAQGYDGRMNRKCAQAEAISRLALRSAYIGAYLAARLNGRSSLVLTLVGGGVFGNSYEWICDAIAEAHRLYGTQPLCKVALLCYVPLEGLAEALRERGLEVEERLS